MLWVKCGTCDSRIDDLEQCEPFDWVHLVLFFLSTLTVMSTATWGEGSTWGKLRVFSPFAGMRRVVARGGCVMSSFDGAVAVVINRCLIQCCLGFCVAVIAWRNKTIYACGVKKVFQFFLLSPLSLLFFFFFASLGEFSFFSLFSTFWFLSSFFLFVFPLCFFFIAPSLLYFLISSSSLSLYRTVGWRGVWIFMFILGFFTSLAYNFIHYLLFLCFFFFWKPD